MFDLMQDLTEDMTRVDNMVYIYALCDPGTMDIKYIGQTVDPLSRIRGHFGWEGPSSRKALWIEDLIDIGSGPIMKIITTCEAGVSDDTEMVYINEALRQGVALLNERGVPPEKRVPKVSKAQRAARLAISRKYAPNPEAKIDYAVSRCKKIMGWIVDPSPIIYNTTATVACAGISKLIIEPLSILLAELERLRKFEQECINGVSTNADNT